MSWDTLSWRPVTAEAPDGIGALVHLAPILRSALEEGASALFMGPVTATDLAFAGGTAAELPDQVLPASSVELLGTPRRTVWAAVEPASATLNGAPVKLDALAGALIGELDAAFVEVLGEGLSVAIATDLPESGASLALFRLTLADGAGATVNLIVAVDENVPTELATHVVALQALGADARTPTPPQSPRISVNELTAQAAAGIGHQASAAGLATPTAGPTAGAAASPSAGDGAGGLSQAQIPGIRAFQLDELPPVAVAPSSQNIELLMGVNLQVTVEIGRTKLAIRDVLALTPGSIVELDKLAGEKVDVLVNGQQIAQGEVVVVDENFGVRITDVVSRQRRILSADTAA